MQTAWWMRRVCRQRTVAVRRCPRNVIALAPAVSVSAQPTTAHAHTHIRTYSTLSTEGQTYMSCEFNISNNACKHQLMCAVSGVISECCRLAVTCAAAATRRPTEWSSSINAPRQSHHDDYATSSRHTLILQQEVASGRLVAADDVDCQLWRRRRVDTLNSLLYCAHVHCQRQFTVLQRGVPTQHVLHFIVIAHCSVAQLCQARIRQPRDSLALKVLVIFQLSHPQCRSQIQVSNAGRVGDF